MPFPVPLSVEPLRAGAVEIDLNRSKVWVGGKAVDLSTKEFSLLRALVEGKGGVLSRDFLLEKIWGYTEGAGAGARTVDVYIHRLRQKLGPEGRRILTVKGVGYRFDISFEWIKFGT